jgi:class 3 adenylate cyclase
VFPLVTLIRHARRDTGSTWESRFVSRPDLDLGQGLHINPSGGLDTVASGPLVLVGIVSAPRLSFGAGAMSQAIDDPLAAAREALRRHEWARGYELFMLADAAGELSPGDIEIMADAAWWAARPDDCIEALERAYAAHIAVGGRARAGYIALSLAREYGGKLARNVASGWLKRATQLLEAEPEGSEHGYLYARRSLLALSSGDLDEAIDLARKAISLGEKFGDRNVEALGLVNQGMALVQKGQASEGLALIDEAAIAAVSGELDPKVTGVVYCNTIGTCSEIADYRRAEEWVDAAGRWCERHAISYFPGDCLVHQAEILVLRGAWPEAEELARRAADELQSFNRVSHIAEAHYQIGEIGLRRGDLGAARDEFRQASELGRDPQPGLSLLLLAEGKADAAAASIKRALDEETNRLARARLLPTRVETVLVAGDVDTARVAADELDSIAAVYQVPALHAAAHTARGAVFLALAESSDAARTLRRAVSHWQDIEAPYETARARVLLARAIKAQGDEEGGLLDLQAARSVFERLGAVPDTKRIDELLAREAPVLTSEPRAARTFMFTDIVGSTNLVEAIGDEAWLDLLRWHDQTLRSLFTEHGGEEVDHAGDGFFVAFNAAGEAVACAVAIQRTLADHRRAHGFAPSVRIGVHATPASRTGREYRGKGVHEAARIASLAGAGEIVASARTLQNDAALVTVREPRTVTLKGLSRSLEVVTIDWRGPDQSGGPGDQPGG